MKLPLEKIRELFPNGKVDHRGRNWMTNCPECGMREFSISLDDNHLFGCYRGKCGFKGNVYTLMKKIGRVDILINKDIKFDKIEKIQLVKEDAELNLELPDIAVPLGWKRITTDSYLESRNFYAFDRYKVGVTKLHPKLSDDFIIFLIEEEERLKGYIARNRKSKKEIERLNNYFKSRGIDKKVYRYLNSFTDFSKLVFGLEEITENTKILIVVEGIFDKFNIDRLLNLYEQDEVVCIATFKCAFSKEQIYKIQQRGVNIEQTILIYDPDVIDEFKKAAFTIRDYMGNVMVGFFDGDKDPGDFDEVDLEKVLSNLQPPSSFGVNKINVKPLNLNKLII